MANIKRVRKAVIPAAGWGTRFLPATKSMPKEMLPIVDTPTIQYIVEEAVNSGIEQICLITSHTKKAIEDHFDRTLELEALLEKGGKTEYLNQIKAIADMVEVVAVRQKEAKGLGHAVLCAKSFVGDEPFAVLLGDDVVYNDGTPCLKQLIDVYNEKGGSVLGVQTVPHENICKYGCVDGEKLGDRLYSVKDMIEKPKPEEAPTDVGVLGRYVITPEIFEKLETTKPGAGGEIQLTDALASLARERGMLAVKMGGIRFDAGDWVDYLTANIYFGLRDEKLRDGLKARLRELLD